jgi:dTDP-4-amino-4,6-dideoxygalactose transaminase
MSKMFPMQSGGLLYAKDKTIIQSELSIAEIKYYKSCFRYYNLKKEEEIIQKRINNYFALSQIFENYGFNVKFPLKPKETPGAFVFSVSDVNLDKLKIFMQRQGIECSVFYGEEAFYIPCHQNMDNRNIDYIETLIKTFLK